jgi:hypothetical protein
MKGQDRGLARGLSPGSDANEIIGNDAVQLRHVLVSHGFLRIFAGRFRGFRLLPNPLEQSNGTVIQGSEVPSHVEARVIGKNRSALNERLSAIVPFAFSYTAVCSGSLSAERASLGIGMLTITEVPEPFDSIFISPWN